MIKAFLRKFFLSLAVLPCSVFSHTKQNYAPPVFTDENRLAKIQAAFPKIDQIYKAAAEQKHFPGYAYGIVVDGRLIHSGSGGYTNLQQKIPATTQSMFRIASMSKSFTAMAILKLRDAGKLSLDDPVYRYIPQLKQQQLTQDSPAITIRNLLTHTAGLPQDDPWGDRKLAESEADLIKLFKKGISFSNAAGVNYEYSNLGYTTLGYIIKKVSGMPYQQFIVQHIWQPLGIQAAWEFSKISSAQLARGYQWQDGHWQEEKLLHDGSYGAMGGMITSIEAFSKYVALHQQAWPPRDDQETFFLKRSSIREMHRPWIFEDLNADYQYPDGQQCAITKAYGYGLHWVRDCQQRVYVKHSGGLPGFGSNWSILPEYGIGVILFTNLTYAAADEVNTQVLDTLIKTAQLKPRQLPVSPVLKARQTALVKLLPSWERAANSDIFAANFFLDNEPERLKKTTSALFAKAGKILHIGDIIPENQLRGWFILKGEYQDLKISFTLTPEKPALIQKIQIEQLEGAT